MIIRELMANTKPNCICKQCLFYPYFHYVGENQLKFYPDLINVEKFDIEHIMHMNGAEVINHTTGETHYQNKLGERWFKKNKNLKECVECGHYYNDYLSEEPFYIDDVCLYCRTEYPNRPRF